jgi:hypothetical protein
MEVLLLEAVSDAPPPLALRLTALVLTLQE